MLHDPNHLSLHGRRVITPIACLLSLLGLTIFLLARNERIPLGKSQNAPAATDHQFRVKDSYGRLPLSFEANRGQVDTTVKYLARGSGYSLFLTSDEAVLSLSAAARAGRTDDQDTERGDKRLRDQNEPGSTERSLILALFAMGTVRAVCRRRGFARGGDGSRPPGQLSAA